MERQRDMFNTTKEQFENHTKFIQSAGFLSSDEETAHKAWGLSMPEVGSSAMKRFHDSTMNFRGLYLPIHAMPSLILHLLLQ